MGFFDIFDRNSEKAKEAPQAQLAARVEGSVQGVGFRWWVAGQAKPLGLVGYAKNMDDGSVQIVAQGSRQNCQKLVQALESGDTAGHISSLETDIGQPVSSYRGFNIL